MSYHSPARIPSKSTKSTSLESTVERLSKLVQDVESQNDSQEEMLKMILMNLTDYDERIGKIEGSRPGDGTASKSRGEPEKPTLSPQQTDLLQALPANLETLAKLVEDNRHLSGELSKSQTAYGELATKFSSLYKRESEARRRLDAYERQIAKISSSLDSLKDSQTSSSSSDDKIEKVSSDVAALKADLERAVSRMDADTLPSQLVRLESTCGRAEKRLTTLERGQTETASKLGEYRSLEDRVQKLFLGVEALQTTSGANSDQTGEVSALRLRLESLESTQRTTGSQLRTLEKEHDATKSSLETHRTTTTTSIQRVSSDVTALKDRSNQTSPSSSEHKIDSIVSDLNTLKEGMKKTMASTDQAGAVAALSLRVQHLESPPVTDSSTPPPSQSNLEERTQQLLTQLQELEKKHGEMKKTVDSLGNPRPSGSSRDELQELIVRLDRLEVEQRGLSKQLADHHSSVEVPPPVDAGIVDRPTTPHASYISMVGCLPLQVTDQAYREGPTAFKQDVSRLLHLFATSGASIENLARFEEFLQRWKIKASWLQADEDFADSESLKDKRDRKPHEKKFSLEEKVRRVAVSKSLYNCGKVFTLWTLAEIALYYGVGVKDTDSTKHRKAQLPALPVSAAEPSVTTPYGSHKQMVGCVLLDEVDQAYRKAPVMFQRGVQQLLDNCVGGLVGTESSKAFEEFTNQWTITAPWFSSKPGVLSDYRNRLGEAKSGYLSPEESTRVLMQAEAGWLAGGEAIFWTVAEIARYYGIGLKPTKELPDFKLNPTRSIGDLDSSSWSILPFFPAPDTPQTSRSLISSPEPFIKPMAISVPVSRHDGASPPGDTNVTPKPSSLSQQPEMGPIMPPQHRKSHSPSPRMSETVAATDPRASLPTPHRSRGSFLGRTKPTSGDDPSQVNTLPPNRPASSENFTKLNVATPPTVSKSRAPGTYPPAHPFSKLTEPEDLIKSTRDLSRIGSASSFDDPKPRKDSMRSSTYGA